MVEDDYQVIAGKRFIKRSGFRKIAVYFGISDRVLSQERTDREDGSFTWRITVEAVAPNSRTCIGVGACDSRERKFAHIEHDVLATAHTRAKSRAISDLVAGGVVSAEEVEAPPSEPEPKPTAAPTTAAPKPEWEVPVTTGVLPGSAGVRQFPLVQGTRALGMLNVLAAGYEASLVPEQPIPAEDPAITNFLVRRVLNTMAAHGFTYSLEKGPDGTLTAILIRGPFEESQIKELQSTAQWAFSKAIVRKLEGG